MVLMGLFFISSAPATFPGGTVLYSSKKMETTILNDGANGRKSSPPRSLSTSPVIPVVPMRHYTTNQSTTQVSTIVVKTTGLTSPTTMSDSARSPMRMINEIKTASQESQADSGHSSGHGSAQPHNTSSEFQPFYKSNELFESNPATESSKLLNTPSRRQEHEADERPPTPVGGILGLTATKMDLERSKRHAT